MSEQSSIDLAKRQQASLAATLTQIAAIWVVSDIGYYLLLPALGQKSSYNDGPIAITIYYAFWVGIAIITFCHLYGRWATIDNRLTSYLLWSASFIGCTWFAAYLLPLLPPTNWTEPWKPPEIRFATAWYFLPKSIEILFQQLLIVALAVTLAAQQYDLRKICFICAALFGGTHLLLALGGAPWGYVIRFTLSAAAFGFIFPYLILRVSNGLIYSYVVHWVYYAVTVAMPHVVAGFGVYLLTSSPK